MEGHTPLGHWAYQIVCSVNQSFYDVGLTEQEIPVEVHISFKVHLQHFVPLLRTKSNKGEYKEKMNFLSFPVLFKEP